MAFTQSISFAFTRYSNIVSLLEPMTEHIFCLHILRLVSLKIRYDFSRNSFPMDFSFTLWNVGADFILWNVTFQMSLFHNVSLVSSEQWNGFTIFFSFIDLTYCSKKSKFQIRRDDAPKLPQIRFKLAAKSSKIDLLMLAFCPSLRQGCTFCLSLSLSLL